MAANTQPIFTLTPNNSSTVPTAANTKSDGAGTIATDIFLLLTAGANGDYVTNIRIMAFASVAATATNATTLRFYRSTKTSGATTSADTHLIFEYALPVITADQTTSAVQIYDFPIERAWNAGETILVSTHIAPAANTGWQVTAFSGSY